MKIIYLALFYLALFLPLTGCFEPDREGYRDMAADDYCTEAERCDNLGNYDSFDDCEVDMRRTFNDWWPADECSDGRIDPDAYDRCMRRALTHACDGGLFDAFSFYDHCQANQVCTN